ncbi:uncharacterized protein PITG_10782 [Phytophthora infestans T30-4]|uniref:Uncharacterized protein n=1 Tax=Phytophthora infestans (strain T30-4) TaxID=403677 RepID=D0NH28_PHYIT|nr:uncharacterized protein PITG_10782 [Phytophthora infestans T30-4]EEY58667.1 hypothetical protein PITG_10782 [Phytophthora infestans T30-4]|eukprot:XP_002901611.1 hypothetical protein PITG_10782 [Phytophthora infestans T30-4]
MYGAEQIRHLKAHDAACMAVQSTVDEEYTVEPSQRKTNHCYIRLLNILFSDMCASRFASSDDAATRNPIDAKEVNQNTQVWRYVTDSFCNNTTAYNGLLVVNNSRFDDIDPSNIVPHETPRLKYVKAYSKFYVSGQNSNDFYNFWEENLDVVNLRACIAIKPELEDDQTADTTAQTDPSTARPEDESTLLDRIDKLHRLIQQVKERQEKANSEGQVDNTLSKSLKLYQQRLEHYETRLTALD